MWGEGMESKQGMVEEMLFGILTMGNPLTLGRALKTVKCCPHSEGHNGRRTEFVNSWR